MAEFNTEGLEELMWAFARQEERATETVEAMLEAEAGTYEQHLKDAAESYGIRKTGGFVNSIKAGETQKEGTAVYKIIAPVGKASHGAEYGGGYSTRRGTKKGKSKAGNVRYATIGFIFEHGTSSLPARPWNLKGNTTAEKPAYEKAKAIWERYVDDCFK